MEEPMSKESHTFNHNEHPLQLNGLAWPAFMAPYIKQVEPYWNSAYKAALTYWHTTQQVAKVLWQYGGFFSPDVRLVLYVLAVLSALPLTLFILYAAATLFIATCAASILGIFITAVGLTLGGLVLAPCILGAAFLSAGAVAAYKVYTCFWRPQASNIQHQQD
ncbi:hypothetical protein BDB00DRAFT_471311 [Zychaea mexicana]|uniref:uncharacterized protein n=1 Tax=Zychaea mexicana TaxID=64656 RepID=UPI0022FE4F97|nr:uncharacterized protein BDB00DRAFT_471311 [Zychaea mexicana]KAI9491752.1 hypothetical protein BDB00DRAFT_471311 [Zychaea mexicana]